MRTHWRFFEFPRLVHIVLEHLKNVIAVVSVDMIGKVKGEMHWKNGFWTDDKKCKKYDF